MIVKAAISREFHSVRLAPVEAESKKPKAKSIFI